MRQARLRVGAVDDPSEREAETLAHLATGSSAPGTAAPAHGAHAADGALVDPVVAQAVQRAIGSGGQPVPSGVRERMERISGADFSDVRIHAGAEVDRLTDALDARAFTVGADVFVRRGEYRPGSADGDALLGHELAHTMQQGAVPDAGVQGRDRTAETPTTRRAPRLGSTPVRLQRVPGTGYDAGSSGCSGRSPTRSPG